MNTLQERLRAAVQKLRRSPMPIADLVPLLQDAADELDVLSSSPLVAKDAVWLIYFDDADVKSQVIVGEEAARVAFDRASYKWNAHLFVKVKSNSRDDVFYSNNAVIASQEEPKQT